MASFWVSSGFSHHVAPHPQLLNPDCPDVFLYHIEMPLSGACLPRFWVFCHI